MYANITTNLENQKPINEIRSRNANQIMMVTRKKLQRALTHALLLTYTRNISMNEQNITFKRSCQGRKRQGNSYSKISTYAHTQSLYYMTSKLQIHGTSQLSQASKPYRIQAQSRYACNKNFSFIQAHFEHAVQQHEQMKLLSSVPHYPSLLN